MTDSIRIFQLAKELNISHTDIVNFLKEKGISVTSHMSPIDGKTQQIVYTEFAKDRQSAERDRKEQVRKEIHDSKVVMETKSVKKFKILSIQDQRDQAKPKKIEAKDIKEDKKTSKDTKSEKDVEKKAPKKKLRKITLRESVSPQDKKEIKKDKEAVKKDTSAVKRLKKTLASMDSSPKKKSYKKAKKDSDNIDTGDTTRVVELAEYASIDEIAKVLDVNTSEVIGKCLQMGILATVNQRLEWDVIELIAGEYEVELKKHEEVVDDLFVMTHTEEELKDATQRAPVVTIMGHVDHGKTSILDYIRKENVVAGESGGITQHIGAYKVELEDDKEITFLDTPGHEAFTAMRARGAQVTDIVVVVVAANDGVMPQTMEAIDHAKAAEVPIVVAINKIDLPEADPDRVKRELSDHEVLVEEWSGKVQAVHVSAKTGEGIDDIMNSILLEAEVLELKANADTYAQGTVIDSRLDKGHGPIATVLIQKGTLNVADPFICSSYSGKVRAMMNERGQRVDSAGPSEAVQVLGFDKVPQAADVFAVFENEKDLKRISSERQRMKREIQQRKVATQSLDAMSALIKDGAIKTLPLIIKGDVDGSIEVLAESLEKIKHEEVGVRVIHKAVGMVNESDVLLAAASNAVVIGFHVQVSSNAKLLANQEGVEIRSYTVIYNAVEEIKLALEGLLEPEKVENIIGRASVQELFKIPKIGFIAGSKVDEGVIKRGEKARVIREEEVIHEGNVNSLKRFKDDVKEVKEGMECGIGVDDFSKFKEGDEIVVFEIQKIKRKLETA